MGLTIWLHLDYSELEEDFGTPTSKIYGNIRKKYLSYAYDLEQCSIIEAQLLDIIQDDISYSLSEGQKSSILNKLKIESLRFVLLKMKVGEDRLYITKEHWEKFRENGILVESQIKIKILYAYSKGERINIFPFRDVES